MLFSLVTAYWPVIATGANGFWPESESSLVHVGVCLNSYLSNQLEIPRDPWALLFPDESRMDSCNMLDSTKFCWLKIRFGPNKMRTSVALGMCLPKTCEASDFEWLAQALCSVPSCNSISHEEAKTLCSHLQPVLCSGLNRNKLNRDFVMQCSVSSNNINNNRKILSGPPEFSNEISFSPAVDDMLEYLRRNYMSWYFEPSIASRTTQWLYDDSDMRAVLSCGSQSISRTEYLMADGGFQQLGDYIGCMKMGSLSTLPRLGHYQFQNPQLLSDAARALVRDNDYDNNDRNSIKRAESSSQYCNIHYFPLLASGRCVHGTCSAERLRKLSDFLCRQTGGPGNPETWETCLDFVNIVPLDLCVMVNVLGCGVPPPELFMGNGVMELVSYALFRKVENRSEEPCLHNYSPPSMVRSVLSHAMKIPSLDHVLGAAFLKKDQGIYKGPFVTNEKNVSEGQSTVVVDCQNPATVSEYPRATRIFLWLMAKFVLLCPMLAALARRVRNSQKKKTSTPKSSTPKSSTPNRIPPKSSTPNRSPLKDSPPKSLPLPPIVTDNIVKTPQKPVPHARPPPPKIGKLDALVKSFEIRSNWNILMNGVRKVQEGEFSHIDGMRVISIIWIIYGHCYSFVVVAATVRNIDRASKLPEDLDFQLVISGQFAVDTFFTISGFVVGAFGEALLNRELSNRKENFLTYTKVFVMAGLKRYTRLIGMTTLTLLGLMYGTQAVTSGPNVPTLVRTIMDGYCGGCRKYWWTTVLFINNLVPTELSDCVGWTWFLSNDMQFFMVAVILLLVRRRNIKAFWISTGALLASSYLAGLVVCIHNGLKVNGATLSAGTGGGGNWMAPIAATESYYLKPWCRMPTYLLGLILGILFRSGTFPATSTKEKMTSSSSSNNNSTNNNSNTLKQVATIGNVIALVTMVLTVYAPYWVNKKDPASWPRWFELAYLVLSRSFWSCAVGWFIVTLSGFCDVFNGFSRRAKKFLSHPFFGLLSAVVFAAYLLHPILQQWIFASYPISYSLDKATVIFWMMCFSALTFSLALPLTVLCEIPLRNLFKIVGL